MQRLELDPLKDKHYVYVWADGVHFNIRLGEEPPSASWCLMGATADGRKGLIAVADGYHGNERVRGKGCSWT